VFFHEQKPVIQGEESHFEFALFGKREYLFPSYQPHIYIIQVGITMIVRRVFVYSSLFFLLYPLPLFGQTVETNILSMRGYNLVGNEFWASGGAGLAERGLSSSAVNNPAGISFPGFTCTVEGMWKPRAEYIADIEYNNTGFFPSYVSIGMPLALLMIEMGYYSTYYEKYDLGEIPVTTVDFPDGNGQVFHPKITTSIQTAFGSFSLHPLDALSIGMTVAIDFIKQDNSILNTSSQITGTGTRVLCGIQYQLSERVGLGGTMHFPSAAKLDLNMNDGNHGAINPLTIDSTNRRPGLYTTLFDLPTYAAKTPFIAEMGLSVLLSSGIKLFAAMEYQQWSDVSRTADDLWQFHAGMTLSLLPELSVQAGFFNRKASNSPESGYFDQRFLTGGCTIRIVEHCSIHFSALSSDPFTKEQHMFSGQSLHQSALSLGFSYSL
jgi:hypothetical protein